MTDTIAHLRLINQSIATPYLTDPVEVVRSLGAVQAQDYGQALWAIGLRSKGSIITDVVKAIESGKILRTWPIRGTIHFVPAEDASWMVALTAERTLRSAKARHAGLGITDEVLVEAEELFRRELQGGKRLPRPVLMQLLEGNDISTKEQRGYHILWTLSLRGVLCIGPMEGKQQTYALLKEWAPQQRHLEHDEALGELARRYFISHGPATLSDFATWAGQPQREAAIGLEIAKPSLASLRIDDKDYWLGRDMRRVPPQALQDTYLLAGFEEYLLGYKDRSDVMQPEGARLFYTNGIFFPIVVKDGRTIGSWRRTMNRTRVSVRLMEFEPFTPQIMDEIHDKVQRYSEFVGLPVLFERSEG